MEAETFRAVLEYRLGAHHGRSRYLLAPDVEEIIRGAIRQTSAGIVCLMDASDVYGIQSHFIISSSAGETHGFCDGDQTRRAPAGSRLVPGEAVAVAGQSRCLPRGISGECSDADR